MFFLFSSFLFPAQFLFVTGFFCICFVCCCYKRNRGMLKIFKSKFLSKNHSFNEAASSLAYRKELQGAVQNKKTLGEKGAGTRESY